MLVENKHIPMKTIIRIAVLSLLLFTQAFNTRAQIGNWLLNNDANDATSNAISGTLTGSPTFSTTAKEGTYALVVNGTSQYVDLGNPTQFPSGTAARTISAWAMTNNVSGSRSIFAYGTNSTSKAMVIGQNGTSLIGGAFASNVTVTNFWATGVWHHICLTYDGTTAKLYADGALVGSSAMSWSLTLAKAFIGRGVNSSDYWSGSIDDVRIYNSTLSAAQVLTLATLTPSSPSGLAVNAASSTTINLSWTDASSNETGFQVERSLTTGTGFSLVTTAAANATSYSDATLSPATTYYYRVRAIDGTYYSTYTSEATTTTLAVPAAPTGLSTSPASSTSINLTWTDASSNETGFQIERSLTTGTGFSVITSTAANVTSFTDTGLSSGTTYYYRMRAMNGSATFSTYTTESSTTTLVVPNVPTGLTASGATSSSITLNWTDASNNETGFQIERSLTTASGFSLVTTTAFNVVTYTDASLTAGTTYYYRVRAINGSSTFSGYSNEANATPLTPPSPPSNLAASPSGSSIGLSWTDGSNNEDGFQIERSLTTGSGFALLGTVGSNVTTYNDATVSSGTLYYYRVRAYKSTVYSTYTSEVSTSTSVLPATPTSLTGTSASSSTVQLTWVDASNNETGFSIERTSTSGSGYTVIGTTSANAITFTDTNLAPETWYYYRIQAVNGVGSSTYTTEINVMTLPTPPVDPTSLTCATTSSSSITLNWSDESDNEAGFEIMRSTTSGSGYSLIATVSTNTNTFFDQGLLENTIYYYKIRAINSGGNSNYTGESQSLTLLNSPSNLTSTNVTANSLVISWSDNSNAETGYQIERSLTPGNGFSSIITLGQNTFTYMNQDLSPGTNYYYRIKAIGGSTTSSLYSDQLAVSTIMSPPASPSNLQVVSSTSSYVNLTWTDGSDNETGFDIERSETQASGYSVIGSVNQNTISYSDQTILPGATYYYKVRAKNDGGFSDYTTIVAAIIGLDGATELCKNIFCTTDGVGIGTSVVPVGYKMAVRGKVIMEGAKIDVISKWPDYVFEDSYPIRDIQEVKNYIKKNGHLPDVPSSATVEREGIDVEQINVLLLQKIEEMSLYLIQMEERIKKLEQENNNLKATKTLKK